MAPSVWLTRAATPSLPLPPMPTGHATVLPNDLSAPPSLATQSGLVFVRKSVKTAVVPEPSERWTTAIASSGRFAFGLSALIAGSFHFVIWPA